MAFTLDETTDRGKCRLLIYDVDSTDYIFEDNQIDALLEMNGDDIWASASDACRVLATKCTSSAFVIKLPGALELDKRDVAKMYMEMAERYDSKSGDSDYIEYVDSVAGGVDLVGEDIGEYIGD